MKLPAGWTSEPFSTTDDRFLVIRAPYDGTAMYVTVDFKLRRFMSGMTMTGRSINKLTPWGRGWRDKLVSDAVKWLQGELGKAD